MTSNDPNLNKDSLSSRFRSGKPSAETDKHSHFNIMHTTTFYTYHACIHIRGVLAHWYVRYLAYGFDSHSGRHVGTLGKSFTRCCLKRFGVKLRHSIIAVVGSASE